MNLEQLVQLFEQIGWDIMGPVLQSLVQLSAEEWQQLIQYAQQQGGGGQGRGAQPQGQGNPPDERGQSNLYG